MCKGITGYKESLLQWIWQNYEFDHRALETESGKPIHIIENGTQNHGAGPDFLNAKIRIADLVFYGHIEIHNQAGEWYQHEHHTNSGYNNVILHVVFSSHNIGKPVKRKDQTPVPVLNLKPYLSEQLSKLLAKSRRPELPCGKHASFINQEAFTRQIEIAHREYFSYKADELIRFYDSKLPVSKAWIECVLNGIYNTLGMPGNREQMLELKRRVSSPIKPGSSLAEVQSVIQSLAFNGNITWQESGFRPANHPKSRTQQAAAFHFAILQIPFQTFFKDGVSCWREILSHIPSDLKPGKQMLSLIFNTVYLPSCWLLGDLLHSKTLKQDSLEKWNNQQQYLSGPVKKPFQKAGFKVTKKAQKLGLAHQLKRYCNELQCQRCEVFKSAIRS